MADWVPPSAVEVPDDEWMPESAKIPVKAHSRARRPARAGFEAIGQAAIDAGLVSELPTIGGFIGGRIGGVPGAGIGGSGGEAARQLLSYPLGLETPQTSQEAARLIAESGIEQAGQEATGALLVKGASRLGGVLTGKSLSHATAKAEDAVRVASKGGMKFDPVRLMTGGVAQLYDEAKLVSEASVNQVKRLAQNFMMRHQGPMSALRLHRIRQLSDDIAEPVFKAMARGEVVGQGVSNRARFYKAVADESRGMLRERIPNYELLEKEVQQEIKNRRLLPRVQQGPIKPTLSNLMGVTEVAGRALGGPGAQMFYGNLASHPLIAMLLSQLPRAATAGVQSAQGQR